MPLADNKKAFFDYEMTEKFSAGIELLGLEVKSLQKNKAQLTGSYIIIRGNEAFLINLLITPYQADNTPKDYNPTRNRKLLLTKKELIKLEGLASQKGLTLIPISIYNKGQRIKLDFGLAKRKKNYDKRQTIKKRDAERDIAREFKR